MRNNKNYNINIICNIKLTILQEKAKHLSIYYNTIVITAVMRLKKLITMMIDNNMVKNFFYFTYETVPAGDHGGEKQ